MLHEMSKLRIVGITALMAFALVACGSATTGSAATGSTLAAAPTATSAGETLPTSQQGGAPVPAATAQPETSAAPASATAKLNLNELTEDQLLSTIPNFPNRMVREFFEYRPYISIQQFRKEIGKYVSAEQVAAYEQYVYVPVDVDQADSATLQQLPGVDANIANQLIAGRPYGSNQPFLAKLAGYVSAANVKQAEAYLAAK
jgi:DNA uptake protein ComE-like DNA-binding protein